MASSSTQRAVLNDNRGDDCQSALTRLQYAIGVKQRVQSVLTADVRNRARLAGLDGTKPTEIDLDNAPVLVCLVTRLSHDEDGSMTSARLGVSTLDTRKLSQIASGSRGENFAQLIDTQVWESETFIATYDETQKENASHVVRLFDAALLKVDGLRNVILVLDNHATTLHELSTLGFNPFAFLRVIDSLNVGDLWLAYHMRKEFGSKPAFSAAGGRTPIQYNYETNVMASEVWKLLERYGSEGPLHDCSMGTQVHAHLTSAIYMAVRDAVTPGWLHSITQLDGGDYPYNPDDFENAHVTPTEALRALKFLGLMASAQRASTLRSATLSKHAAPASSATPSAQPQDTSPPLRPMQATRGPATSGAQPTASSQPTTSAPSATTSAPRMASVSAPVRDATSPVAAPPPQPMPPRPTPMPFSIARHVGLYREASIEFSARLVDLAAPFCNVEDYMGYWRKSVSDPFVLRIRSDSYFRLVGLVMKKYSPDTDHTAVKLPLKTQIVERSIVNGWHHKLPAGDARLSASPKHHKFLRLLKGTSLLLEGKLQEFKRKKESGYFLEEGYFDQVPMC